MPYANHTMSYVENDPIVLPNGRIYGQQRLLDISKKIVGTSSESDNKENKVKDPTTGEIFDVMDMKKVFIL